ncbi:MAG: response regulator transcription factor [Candidatus Aminicenantes bacterium]|nr:response regulator transcription factor [Candidatus Aminicenantes bacterium]
MKKRLYLVEDDPALRETTSAALEMEGFQVKSAADGEAALEAALREKPDLLILDIMLPGLSGFEVCRLLREKGCASPVIFLSGQKVDEIDKVVGLELGADDYLLKPFGMRELIARVKAVLRRARPEKPAGEELVIDDIRVNFKTKTAFKGKKELALTAKEFGLLELLAAHEGEVVGRETILNEVWGYEKFPTTRTVDTFVHHLRRKIEPDPARPVHLLTVPWLGYKFHK